MSFLIHIIVHLIKVSIQKVYQCVESDRWNVDEGTGHLTLILVGYIKLYLLTTEKTEACATSGRACACTIEIQTEYINIYIYKMDFTQLNLRSSTPRYDFLPFD